MNNNIGLRRCRRSGRLGGERLRQDGSGKKKQRKQTHERVSSGLPAKRPTPKASAGRWGSNGPATAGSPFRVAPDVSKGEAAKANASGQMIAALALININADPPFVKRLLLRAGISAIACRTVAFHLCAALLPIVAFGQSDPSAGQAPKESNRPGPLVDHLGNVLFRPFNSFGEGTDEEAGPMGPAAFGFVPGHYYTSNFFSRVITEYDGAGTVTASYTVPSALGQEVKGLAFGADGLLYAAMFRGSAGFAVLALRSDGSVAASYAGSAYIGGNLSHGKIALDSQYLYVCAGGSLIRFLLGDPSSGTMIYGGSMFDVKSLPNGRLFVAMQSSIDEITNSGAFVRRIELTGGGFGDSFTDIRGVEYNPTTNILFVTHLGHTDFSFRIIRLNATTGALLNSATFVYADDMLIDSSGNLLVGSSDRDPTFFSQDLVQGSSLNGGQQMFVTQYAPVQAFNISTRMRVETGNNVLIGGFIITGTAPKIVAVRGIGPSLTPFGIPDALVDPILELRDSSGALVRQNDNWQDDPSQASQLTALGLALQNPNESGIVNSLSPSAYTAILAGNNGGTGVGLVEIYDTTPGANSQLANISTRGLVQTGSNVMIGGFILGGANTTNVAVRGIGPSLASIVLDPVLANPTLALHDGNGALLISNDNWQDDPAQASQLSTHGLALQDANESGIFASLPPGSFTAILAGNNGGMGIGLVEIYNVH